MALAVPWGLLCAILFADWGFPDGGEFPDTPPIFCFSAKERQLVQVVVSSYTYPTFVLSVAVVLLVVSC